MAGYSNIMPTMDGMGQAGNQAAVAGAGQTGMNPSLLSNQSQGLIDANINPITGANLKPTAFGAGGIVQMGIGAISTLGSLWNSYNQSKIAKKSLALQERTFETNLANQTKTYNTELEDRIRTRYDSERRDPSEADAYVERNRL